jgi:excisionase family DNA binding protein
MNPLMVATATFPAPAPTRSQTTFLQIEPHAGDGVSDGLCVVGPCDVLLVRPEDAARVLGVGRTKIYELIRSGALRSVRVGGLRRVPVAALNEFVTRLEEEAA